MTIEERLEKLERTLNRAQFINRLLAVLAIGSVLAMWFFASGLSTAQERIIRAKLFIVEDEIGNPRIILGVNKYGPGVSMMNKNGDIRTTLCINNDGPALSMLDENGKLRSLMSVTYSRSTLYLHSNNEKTSVGLAVVGEDTSVSLIDKNGITRAGMDVIDDNPSLSLWDNNKTVIWETP